MIAEECISEYIKWQDRLYQIVQEIWHRCKKKKRKKKLDQGAIVLQVGGRVLRQNKRSQQRKGGKLDPDFFTFTFMHLADTFIQSDLQ